MKGSPGGSPHREARQLSLVDIYSEVANKAKALTTVLLLTHNST